MEQQDGPRPRRHHTSQRNARQDRDGDRPGRQHSIPTRAQGEALTHFFLKKGRVHSLPGGLVILFLQYLARAFLSSSGITLSKGKATASATYLVRNVSMNAPCVCSASGPREDPHHAFHIMEFKRQPELRNPTVFILMDRKQLEKQFRETFTNAESPYTRWADRIDTLQQLIQHESREVIITTIQKFHDIPHIDTRDNIIIHEAAHLTHFHHQKGFHHKLEQIIHDHNSYEQQLQQYLAIPTDFEKKADPLT